MSTPGGASFGDGRGAAGATGVLAEVRGELLISWVFTGISAVFVCKTFGDGRGAAGATGVLAEVRGELLISWVFTGFRLFSSIKPVLLTAGTSHIVVH
jgi:hypothetical protein